MNVNCSTCLELLTPSANISCAPCGHIFHTTCIQKWMETGKSNCPQCRTKFAERQLRRIFFTEALDVTMNTQDTCVLSHRVDGLTFQVRCLEREKKEAVEERDEATARSVALVEEVRSLEVRLSSAKEETLNYKAQNRLLQGEKRKADLARKEAEELRDKLNLYKNIELIVNGSEAQVKHKMHQMGDFSKAAKDMSYMVETLKNEMEKSSKEVSAVRKEISHKNFQLDNLKSENRYLQRRCGELTSEGSALTSDIGHLEEEVSSLKLKLKGLQDALDSPSGDPKLSAINRLIQESPAPAKHPNMTDENDIFCTPNIRKLKTHKRVVLSPLASSVSECGIVGLGKTKSTTDATNLKTSLQLKMWPSFSSSKPPKKTTMLAKKVRIDDLTSPTGTFYNGLGGHSKPDDFPTPIRNQFKVNNQKTHKKPKGVSRPKTSATSNTNSKPIDSFFTALIEDE